MNHIPLLNSDLLQKPKEIKEPLEEKKVYKKRGRKPGVFKDGVKSTVAFFRINEKQKTFIDQAATAEGRTFSSFVLRAAVLDAKNKIGIDPNQYNEAHLLTFLRAENKKHDKKG